MLGANGMLGGTLSPVLEAAGHKVIRHARTPHAGLVDAHADLADRNATLALFNSVNPDVVINLAAASNVDLCESDPQLAYLGNVITAANVARALRGMRRAHLIHISTDQLYDGIGPHAEAHVVIRNMYAQTKRAGELLFDGSPATILRTNFFGPSRVVQRTTLSDWITSSLTAGSKIPVFTDVLFSPLTMCSLSQVIVQMLHDPPIGVFNVGSREGMTKADFAFAVAKSLDLREDLLVPALSDSGLPNRARRPKDMRMNVAAIENVLGRQMPLLSDEIKSLRATRG